MKLLVLLLALAGTAIAQERSEFFFSTRDPGEPRQVAGGSSPVPALTESPLGRPFSLEIHGLPAGVTSLRVTLTSMCDDEKVVESNGSRRESGKYYADLFVSEKLGACSYKVFVTFWEPNREYEEYLDATEIQVK